MIDKDVLAKIRKCLALVKSANENEAAAALAKAQALMQAHGIDDEMLALAEFEESAARGQRAQRPPVWETLLARTVEHALNVCSFIDDNLDRRFVGRGPKSEIAAYAFLVLYRQLKAARRSYIATHLKRCKPARKRVRADIFCEAWAASVCHKIKALIAENERDAGLDQYLAVRHPGLVTIDARQAKLAGKGANDDYWYGRNAGSKVELNKGVGAGEAQKALI
jgi:hypothetical protein